MRALLYFVIASSLCIGQNPNTAVFPGSVAGDGTLLVASDNASSSLATAIGEDDTSFTLVSATGFAAPTALTIGTEIIRCSTLTGTAYSGCTRRWLSSSRASHSRGAIVVENMIAYYHNQTSAEMQAVQGALGTNLSKILAVVSTDPSGSCPTNNTMVVSYSDGLSFVCTSGTWRRAPGAQYLLCSATSGSGSAFACNISPAISSYQTGAVYAFKADIANSGAATINFNSIGAAAIKKYVSGSMVDLAANDIGAGQWVSLQYDGTYMQASLGGGGTVSTSGVAGPSSSTIGYVPVWNAVDGTSIGAGVPLDAASTPNAIPQADGSGHIANSFLPPILTPTAVQTGDGSETGYVDMYPAGDNTNSVGFTTGARSSRIRFGLPTSSPTSGQLMVFSAPSGATPPISTATWSTPPTITGTPVAGNCASFASATSFSDAGAPCGSGGGSSAGYLDLSAGGSMGGVTTGVWVASTGLAYTAGPTSIPSVQFSANGDTAKATVRLPPTWTGSSVSVKLTVMDKDNVTGTVPYTLQIGCITSGSSALTDPTLGTALSFTGTQTGNNILEMTASPLYIPGACTEGTLARFVLTRGTHGRTGTHGVVSVYLTW